jgi:hypothetical protein
MTLKNFLGQFHNWLTTAGVAIILAIALYVAGDSDWTIRGVVVIGLGAFAKWLATHYDHKKAKEAVKKEGP